MNHGDSRRTLAGTLVGHSGPETTRVALPHSQHPIVSYHPAFLARTVRVHAVQFGVLTEKCPCMVSTWPPVRQLHTCSHGGVHHPMRLRQPVQQQIKHRIRWPSGHIALTPCLKSGGCGNDVLRGGPRDGPVGAPWPLGCPEGVYHAPVGGRDGMAEGCSRVVPQKGEEPGHPFLVEILRVPPAVWTGQAPGIEAEEARDLRH